MAANNAFLLSPQYMFGEEKVVSPMNPNQNPKRNRVAGMPLTNLHHVCDCLCNMAVRKYLAYSMTKAMSNAILLLQMHNLHIIIFNNHRLDN